MSRTLKESLLITAQRSTNDFANSPEWKAVGSLVTRARVVEISALCRLIDDMWPKESGRINTAAGELWRAGGEREIPVPFPVTLLEMCVGGDYIANGTHSLTARRGQLVEADDRTIRAATLVEDINGSAGIGLFEVSTPQPPAFVDSKVASCTLRRWDGGDIPDEWDDGQIGAVKGFTFGLLAMLLLNAREIRLVNGISRQQRRGTERHGKPREEWHSVVIDPIVYRRLQLHRQTYGAARALRLHYVRGHAADYTQGRGLFGKYKVPIRKRPHYRGDPERGILHTDQWIIE